IRELTLKSIAPAKIYEEGDLIKRTIRDLYSKDIDEVIVAGAEGFRTAKDFMRMIMPSHAKNVKQYAEQMPLYARYQVEGYLAGMFNPTVQLPSGGYIVIGVTEALVAVDVNSGRATKEGSIEQTALKTNLEAADEVARQMRLRDLAGLIVIDFIDMDERRNNVAVEKRFKDALKTDRARIQVGRISGFGLMEMSRQRLRPGMLEATTQPCPHCHGTGLLRSDDNVVLNILRQIEEEGTRARSKEVLVRAPVSIANVLMNGKRDHIASIESRYGMSVRVECDVTLVSPDFAIDKFKTATRVVPDAQPFVPPAMDARDQADEHVFDEVEAEEVAAPVAVEADASTEDKAPQARTAPDAEADDQPRKKRRRRRRRRGGAGGDQANDQTQGDDDDSDESDDGAATTPDTVEAAPEEKPKRTRSRSRKPKAEVTAEPATDTVAAETATDAPAEAAPAAADAPAADEAPKKRTRTRRKPAAAAAEGEATEAPAEEAPKPKRRSRAKKPVEAAAPEVVTEAEAAVAVAETPAADATTETAPVAVEVPPAETAPEQAPAAAPETMAQEAAPEVKSVQTAAPAAAEAPESEAEADVDEKPKKRGWWSLGR
ncbi:MAG: ribonuclease E/G, partial [Alphaproteobacteria bacterium]|nr:ribonuclease E/G [Alphaproteobacteria bacterium]